MSDLDATDEKNKPQPKHGHEHHHHLPFHHLQHRSHRLLHLIHPSGKHIHVVHHPTEVDNKKRELAKDPKGALSDNYDIVVYGTPEHLSCIKDVREHHLTRRDGLREKNAELFQEFDEVHETLDHLSDELSRLTDHAVSLDASFSKFGYSAHLRTKEDSEASSLNSGHEEGAPKHQDRSREPFHFYKTPTIRQYFHKGLLWRSARSGEVGSFELFTDLIYVGVIDYIGEAAVTNASAETFLHFVIVFALAYKIWSDLTVAVNWFEVEDVFGRLAIILVLCCLYGFNSNVEYFFSYTYTAGISFYLTQRLLLVTVYAVFSYVIPMIRGALLMHVLVGVLASVMYIISIHVDYPNSLAPLFLGLSIDYFGGVSVIFFMRYVKENERRKGFCKKIAKQFEFLPGMNIEHRVERTSAFTTLVFGYSILKSLYQSHAHVGVNAFLGKGILIVVQTFTILWIYFDIDGIPVHVHAIRRHYISSVAWISSHLFLSGAFILASSTLTDLVLAHDCPHSNPEDLADAYLMRSVEEIEQPLRWFYCGGLAVTLLFLTIISYCHIHKKLPNPRITKTARLITRVCVSIILICLPLAHLNSLNLIAVTTSLFTTVLILDIFGNTCPGDRFFTGGYANCPETRCKYTAKLKIGKKKRAELEKRLADGQEVKLEDALRRNTSRSESISSGTTLDVGEEWHGGHV